MAFTVRSILGKTRLHRPDLREAEIDYLTQEIVRKVCRLTMLAQREIIIDFNGPITGLDITDPDGFDINRLHLVQWQDTVVTTPAAPTYTVSGVGTNPALVWYKLVAVGPQNWISLPGPTLVVNNALNQNINLTTPNLSPPAPNGFDHYDLYRSTDSGLTWKKSTTEYAQNVTFMDTGNPSGYVVSELPTEATGDYRILAEGNTVQVNDTIPKPETVFGVPNLWSFNALDARLKFYPPPDNNQIGARVKVLYSFIPTGEIDEIPLLPEAEDCIYYGTLAEAFMLPGPATNPNQALRYEVKFNNEISNLRAVATMGNSGRLVIPPRPLGGRRRIPYSAFGNPWPNSWGW